MVRNKASKGYLVCTGRRIRQRQHIKANDDNRTRGSTGGLYVPGTVSVWEIGVTVPAAVTKAVRIANEQLCAQRQAIVTCHMRRRASWLLAINRREDKHRTGDNAIAQRPAASCDSGVRGECQKGVAGAQNDWRW